MEKSLTAAGQRVLDAAGELFYREGIHAVGVALVAERAGVTKKTLYDCFGSKDALVTRYLRARHERWWAHLEQRLATASSPLTLFDAYLDHPALATARGCAFLNAAGELPPGHPGLAVVREHKAAVRHRLGELVAEARPDAVPAETEEVADLLWLVLEGAVAHLGLDGDAAMTRARRIARVHLGG